MPAMGGRGGGGLMVPRGGMGRRSSCYPGGGIPSVHSTGRRASSRSEAGIGIFPGLLGGSKNPKVSKIDFNEMYLWQRIDNIKRISLKTTEYILNIDGLVICSKSSYINNQIILS